jgi:hypothetical protein
MAKGKQRPPQYNRQSMGYQQNLYKREQKLRNAEMPKAPDTKKILKITRWGAAIWLIVTIALTVFFGWKAVIPMVVIAAAYAIGITMYMRDFEKKYILAYKKMDVPKDVFLKQLKKGGTDAKSIAKISKKWDKLKVD